MALVDPLAQLVRADLRVHGVEHCAEPVERIQRVDIFRGVVGADHYRVALFHAERGICPCGLIDLIEKLAVAYPVAEVIYGNVAGMRFVGFVHHIEYGASGESGFDRIPAVVFKPGPLLRRETGSFLRE